MKTKRIKTSLTRLTKIPHFKAGSSSSAVAVAEAPGCGNAPWLRVIGARQNNLKNITVEIPLQRFVAVTGVSGSGKSSLVNDILREALARDLNGAEDVTPGAHERIEGLEHLDKVIDIDQSPIGRTPRSNPATYIKVFDQIRDLYTRLPDAKVRGYKPGRFSFNVSTGEKGGGRCEACEGNGSNKMEMELLADVWVTCPVCTGRRFSRETLQILYKGKSIADVLEMDVQEALAHFEHVPKIASMLRTLHDVGLDYMKLGQSSTTLSGGEAQRIKLARELVKKSTGRTLYLLDEPTTGLHFADIKRLLSVLHGFVDAGNTVVVIEHNLDVIKTADWIIDLGPEGGSAGGEIMACGTPEEVARCERSYTGIALRDVLSTASGSERTDGKGRGSGAGGREELRITNSREQTVGRAMSAGRSSSITQSPNHQITKSIKVVGARQHNLKDITVEIPRDKITVCSGPSGSGKSSFAIDTVYTEGQRRYVESLSSYARQFLGRMQPPKVDHVYGLSPAICIEQKNTSRSPRSTVGTVTEIYDYMRVLWTRIGQPHCPKCRIPIGTQTSDEIVERILSLGEGTRLLLLAPVEPGAQETYASLLQRERTNGYARARIDGVLQSLDEPSKLDAKRKHQIELVIDRIIVRAAQRTRICDSVEQALAVGQGVMILAPHEEAGVGDQGSGVGKKVEKAKRRKVKIESTPTLQAEASTGRLPNYPITKLTNAGIRFSQHHSCSECGTAYEELTPHHFSFNTRMGWCDACEGLGVQQGASPSAIVIRPTRSIVDGAILGWGEVAPGSLLYSLATAVAEHIGFDASRPWGKLSERQQLRFLQGCGGEWIEMRDQGKRDEGDALAGHESQVAGQRRSTIDDRPARSSIATSPNRHITKSFRVQWRGFFPAIDRATRINNDYRDRLADLVTDIPCEACGGGRLKPEPLAVRLADCTIRDVCSMPLSKALDWFGRLKLDTRQKRIAGELLHEVTSRLRFLVDVGLDYLSLHRRAASLSGGEAQRIQLASQIGTGLTGVLYVLDEPTIGLHPRDNNRLIGALKRLRDLGNTLLLVEHDREVIDSADHVLDFGPGAGTFGGTVTAAASPAKLRTSRNSLTGKYLAAKEAIAVPSNRRPVDESTKDQRIEGSRDQGEKSKSRKVEKSKRRTPAENNVFNWLIVCGARENNLKELDVAFPLGRFTCVTGVSGSGKSTLVSDILCNALQARIHRARVVPGGHEKITGVEHIDKVINVDQSPIGNSPMSNPATYTGAFDAIREVFAKLPLSKIRGYTANRFSFNRAGGRCEACEGMGQRCIEMHFLPDVWIDCENCKGARYVPETLEIAFRGKSIADVLSMRISESADLFDSIPKVRRILRTLDDVGLGYLQLGQSAPTLSGGEAQRVKLAAELGKPSTGKTLYMLDEPTTGLHFEDLRKLLGVLHRLVDLGNTVICIEHNLDVIKTADWVIDLGPEAGEAGGQIVAAGPPDLIASTAASYTGRALKPVLELGPVAERPVFDAKKAAQQELAKDKPIDLGEQVKMPWEVDGQTWHTVDHLDHNGEPVEWEPALLTWLVDAIHSARDEETKGRRDKVATKRRSDEGERSKSRKVQTKAGFEATDWNHRSRVEITAGKNEQWFCHILTGNKDLLEVAIRVPRRTFTESPLGALLKIKTLDEREELPIYGQWDRTRIRSLKGIAGDWDDIRLSLRDMKDIDNPGFSSFLKTAIDAYFRHLAKQAESPELSEPWKVDGQQWHLSHKGMSARQKPKWSSALLLAVVGRLKSLDPQLTFDWSSSKTGVNILAGDGARRGKIVTNMGRGLRVCLLVPAGVFTPAQVDRLGEDVEIKPCRENDWVAFWLKSLTDNDAAQLREVWTRASEGPEPEQEELMFA